MKIQGMSAEITQDLLPDSRTRERRGGKPGPGGLWYVPTYCANCGGHFGYATDTPFLAYLYYLCDRCAADLHPPDPVVDERIVRGA